ncbi:MAG: SHD1 domain-containing protein, partial [Pirellulaceae bacterium]|nr:SHD1 domain-containing protein [Pirellulaceae bacterium]
APANESGTDDSGAAAVENSTRLWVDNTGSFKTRGALIEAGETFVRLRKENGKIATVPRNRLSAADLDYVVQWRASSQLAGR